MKRHDLLTTKTAGVAAAAASAITTAPAITQGKQRLTMVTSWPKNLPGPGVYAQKLADRIGELSAGRLEIKLHAAGEIVPLHRVFDAIAEGTADIYHSVPYYWSSKSKDIVFFGSQPFGLDSIEQLVNKHDVKVYKLPEDILQALGEAAKEVIAEMRDGDDPLVKKITENFIAYRDLIGRLAHKALKAWRTLGHWHLAIDLRSLIAESLTLSGKRVSGRVFY